MSLLRIEEAFARLDAAIEALPVERAALSAALDRVTAQPVGSACDLPPFDQSAMDGYALRAGDVHILPARFPLAATIAAGPHESIPVLPPGHACRIYTGGLIPLGADAVVRQEWTAREGDEVLILRPTPVGQDIRTQGEELRRGELLIEAGRRLNAGHLAMLAMAGVADIPVRRAPRIRVLVSGDEVVDAGRVLKPGEVYNANGPLIAAWLTRAGYRSVTVEQVGDTEAAVREALRRGFMTADLVLTTGGVSVGDLDLIAPEAEKLGARRILWKVAQKPGKPLYVARCERSLLIGLPGNPGSVLVNLASFVRRALDCLEGLSDPGPCLRIGVLARDAKPDAERDTWLRVEVVVDGAGVVNLHPQSHQASHMLSNLSTADALVWLPAGIDPVLAGQRVRWLSLSL